MQRTQIYLTEAESTVLQRLAKARGTTQSQLVREAIDAVYLNQNQAGLEAVLAATAGAWQREASGADVVEGLRNGALARRLLTATP